MLTVFELHSILKERQHGWKGQVISSVLTTFFDRNSKRNYLISWENLKSLDFLLIHFLKMANLIWNLICNLSYFNESNKHLHRRGSFLRFILILLAVKNLMRRPIYISCNNIVIDVFPFNDSSESIKTVDIIFSEGQNTSDNPKWNNSQPKGNIFTFECELHLTTYHYV